MPIKLPFINRSKKTPERVYGSLPQKRLAGDYYSKIISTLAIIISLTTLTYNLYKDYKSNEEMLIIRLAAPAFEETISYANMGSKGIIKGLHYTCVLSNTSTKRISIIGYNFEAVPSSKFPAIMYTGMFNGFTNTDGQSISLPINIDSGEAIAFRMNIGVLVNEEAHKTIIENFGVGELNYNDIRVLLANNGLEIYGNKIEIDHYDDEAYIISHDVDDRTYPTYRLELITANNNKFETTFVCDEF